jgi:APA family basic amino acid/polyamine antiporter
MRRSLGSPTLFAIVYTSVASSIYFALGVVTDHALGLTPVVFLVGGLFFVLAAMTYVEGASLHQERAGSTVFARYAFNELVSFVAGWAILLDYIILIAVTSLTATNYLAAFYGPFGHGPTELIVALAIVGYVALRNIRGFGADRARKVSRLVVADLALQALIVVLGLAMFLHPDVLLDSIHLGSSPQWKDVMFALGIATVVFTGLESASGLAGEVMVKRRDLQRLISSATVVVLLVYVGIGLVAVTATPIVGGESTLARNFLEDPMVGIAESFHQQWLADTLKYVVATLAAITLVAAASSAMMGLSRLAYSLSTNRQIPSAVGRLHPTRSTPYVTIIIASVLAAALVIPEDLDFLVGIFAFGALLGLTIAHMSIIVLRFREPDRKRPYRMPFSVRVRGAKVPVPAVIGAIGSALVWLSVVITHQGARYVGFAWLVAGIALYVVYRKTEGKSLLRRVVVPEAALRAERHGHEGEYGSILVPLFGGPLDDDIMQTAGRLAAEEDEDALEENTGATIEAVWIFVVPMSLPIDAALPEAQLKRARAALARAKAVGEEYEGVQVATATVRARRAGAAIVEEAKRRGVQAIVLAAEEPTKVRGGALLGGRGGPRENFVGDVTKYVVAKAHTQVILTAPPAEAMPSAVAADKAAGAGGVTAKVDEGTLSADGRAANAGRTAGDA